MSRVTPVQTAMRNCTGDEGRTFEVGNQVLISRHHKLLSSKAMVVNVADQRRDRPCDLGRRFNGTRDNFDRERRATCPHAAAIGTCLCKSALLPRQRLTLPQLPGPVHACIIPNADLCRFRLVAKVRCSSDQSRSRRDAIRASCRRTKGGQMRRSKRPNAAQ